MAQQTAVEWLIYQLKIRGYAGEPPPELLFERARQMEMEQIIKTFQSSRIPYKYGANLTLNGFEDAEH